MPTRDDDLDDDDRPVRPRRQRDDDDEPPQKKSSTGLIVGILVGIFVVCCGGGGTALYFILVGIQKGVEQMTEVVQGAAEASQSQQNLVQIGVAVQQHERAVGQFPNNTYETRGKQSRALLSWRVHILPFLGENALYQQFKLDEPWDSQNNIKLLGRMPNIYGTPAARKKTGEGKTYYRGFVAPGGIFEKPPAPGNPTPKVTVASVTDGISNTILIVEAGEAVEWSKPDDLDFSPGKPRPALGGAYPNLPFVLVLMADGSVHQMRADVSDETLRKLIDRKDGEVIPTGWDQ
jgi:Protein of unknown function (DUF1559)